MAIIELFAYAHWISIVLFFVGIGFLVAEMFDPGFGIFGTGGIISFIACIFVTARTVNEGIMLTGFFFAIIVILLGIFVFLVSKDKLPSRLILKAAETKEDGYSATNDMSFMLGKTGVVTTMCRPAGNVSFDGMKLDVVTQGEFIDKGQQVEVIEVEGNRIVVKAIS